MNNGTSESMSHNRKEAYGKVIIFEDRRHQNFGKFRKCAVKELLFKHDAQAEPDTEEARKQYRKRIIREYNLLKSLKHANIVELFGWTKFENRNYGIVTEYMKGESLYNSKY